MSRSQPEYHLLMMRFVRNYVLILQLLLLLDCSSAFSFVQNDGRVCISLQTSFLGMSSSAAHDLLYQDQQAAMERRALKEQELLSTKKVKELKASKLKVPSPKSGTGFGGGGKKASMSPMQRLASEQAKIVHREGVIRINKALSSDLSDKLREYVLEQQSIAAIETEKDLTISKIFYGVENQRKHRCDLQLSLQKGGFAADIGGDVSSIESHVLADALQELLGQDGTLRPLYENLVTMDGEFYELATVITNPGSPRQQVHPDLPHKEVAPLYVIFLALQDVNKFMGPTTFLLRTHTAKENAIFNDYSQKDDQLVTADSRLATLKKGDAVLFDARILHCGNANDAEKGSDRALFNFSFRNPKVVGSLGYAGSIRPGYTGAMTLGDLSKSLDAYSEGDKKSFEKYGDGIFR
mmetsp:Transcript_15435/g.17136  ORF Transcript_15435/g.17136 Transcript_15435/m.17136 type:complete len:409 (-) Transcript_15435:248-1474(-)